MPIFYGKKATFNGQGIMIANFNWARRIPSPLLERIATLGALGYVKKGPGTVGSIAGIAYYLVFFFYDPPLVQLIFSALAVWFAIGICGEAEVRLQKRDPGEIILDEFVAIPLVFLGIPMAQLPQPWIAVCLGFVLFRFFDILKPLGIARLQHLPGGTGVVLDDVAAALASCFCLHLLLIVLAR